MAASRDGEDALIPNEKSLHQPFTIHEYLDAIGPDLIFGSFSPIEPVVIDLFVTRFS